MCHALPVPFPVVSYVSAVLSWRVLFFQIYIQVAGCRAWAAGKALYTSFVSFYTARGAVAGNGSQNGEIVARNERSNGVVAWEIALSGWLQILFLLVPSRRVSAAPGTSIASGGGRRVCEAVDYFVVLSCRLASVTSGWLLLGLSFCRTQTYNRLVGHVHKYACIVGITPCERTFSRGRQNLYPGVQSSNAGEGWAVLMLRLWGSGKDFSTQRVMGADDE